MTLLLIIYFLFLPSMAQEVLKDQERKLKSKYKKRIKRLKEEMVKLIFKINNMEKFFHTKIEFIKRSHNEEKDKLYDEIEIVTKKYTDLLLKLHDGEFNNIN